MNYKEKSMIQRIYRIIHQKRKFRNKYLSQYIFVIRPINSMQILKIQFYSLLRKMELQLRHTAVPVNADGVILFS